MQKLTILFVDDSKVIIDRLVPLIKDEPNIAKVLVGNDFEAGKSLLEQNNFDIAILDINMPGKSGIELLQFIKGGAYPNLKVIMMTSDPTEEKKQLCLSYGADLFVSKFSEFEQIIEFIEDASSNNNLTN